MFSLLVKTVVQGYWWIWAHCGVNWYSCLQTLLWIAKQSPPCYLWLKLYEQHTRPRCSVLFLRSVCQWSINSLASQLDPLDNPCDGKMRCICCTKYSPCRHYKMKRRQSLRIEFGWTISNTSSKMNGQVGTQLWNTCRTHLSHWVFDLLMSVQMYITLISQKTNLLWDLPILFPGEQGGHEGEPSWRAQMVQVLQHCMDTWPQRILLSGWLSTCDSHVIVL